MLPYQPLVRDGWALLGADLFGEMRSSAHAGGPDGRVALFPRRATVHSLTGGLTVARVGKPDGEAPKDSREHDAGQPALPGEQSKIQENPQADGEERNGEHAAHERTGAPQQAG